MNFANVNTGQIAGALSATMTTPGGVIQGATLQDWAAVGWRRVVAVAAPTAGFRATSYGVHEIDGLTCDLTVATEINIATETAAELEAIKTAAKTLAELGNTEIGLVLRAFSVLVLQEINALRTKTGMVNYTPAQFLAALKAKVDALS